METAKTKRDRIVEAVESHPQLSKVVGYLAEKHEIDKDELNRRFIDFLEREGYFYVDRLPHKVLCFSFDKSKSDFTNRTLTSYVSFF